MRHVFECRTPRAISYTGQSPRMHTQAPAVPSPTRLLHPRNLPRQRIHPELVPRHPEIPEHTSSLAAHDTSILDLRRSRVGVHLT